MINGQAADHDSWLVRCFPRAPGFSRSNQHNYTHALEECLEGGIKDFFKGRGRGGGGGEGVIM